ESSHPDLLRHGLDRERHFDRLWVSVEPWPELVRVVADERRDLQRGDIPMFTNRVGHLDLWTSAGEQIPGWFKESGLDLSRRLISELGPEDLEKQVWIIRAALTSLSPESLHAPRPAAPLIEPRSRADREALLQAAGRIGDRLERIAVRDQAGAAWLGLTAVSQRNWSLAPLGVDLYDGLPGVILFLAYLGAGTAEDRYAALARAALTPLLQQLERTRSSLTAIGGFNGWGGLIYTLMHLGTLWKDQALIDLAEESVGAVPDLIEQDQDYDVIAGSAGCIGALLGFYQCTGSPRSLAAAIQCGEHLVTSSRPLQVGRGWHGRSLGGVALTGFSHGNAGFAWALLRLAALTGRESYRAVALEALAYERSLFTPTGGWPDLRRFDRPASPDAPGPSITAWCHGAPGIGLGRLGMLPWLDDGDIRAEIQAALEITLSRGFGQNHSLCHGDLGNIELLLAARAVLGDPELEPQIERWSAVILESLEHQGTRCGVPLEIETPGLMTGLAGIGYGLLRLAEPSRFPSVLMLAPPVGAAQVPTTRRSVHAYK
ncbi:MAG TPA: type 2 lanthipeptide synthetase LanM, partial [Blastocatellia bacterium]|nr:type 2 lanthipeptide synthetase LanM [Blastocatellia bacterium]